jgi:Transposase, Mutator family
MKKLKEQPTRLDYCQFLLVSQMNYTMTYFAAHSEHWSHDAVKRYLMAERLGREEVWEHSKGLIETSGKGYVVIDDFVLDKDYSQDIELVRHLYSGKEKAQIKGIGLYVNPDLERYWLLDYRIYDPTQDGKSKIVHAREIIENVIEFKHLEGSKEVFGLWIAHNKGATFWLGVLNDLKDRGMEDVFVFCVDGLKGFPEAIEAVYPQSQVQLCIVQLFRNSLNYVPWKVRGGKSASTNQLPIHRIYHLERKAVAADLKAIYNAPNEYSAEQALVAFEQTWNDLYPSVSHVWRRHWQRIIPLINYPVEIRKAIYTTNIIESFNYSLKKVVKTRSAFPDEDSLFKVLHLAIRNDHKKMDDAYQGLA